MKRRVVCLICKRDFTRKWNAIRHNFKAHAGQATIVPIHNFPYGPAVQPDYPTSHYRVEKKTGQDELTQFMEEIRDQFEELESEARLLSDQDKKKLLGFAIYGAAASPNHKDSMRDSINLLRNSSSGTNGRMLNCVASFLNVGSIAAKEMLRTVLEAKPSGKQAGGIQ